MTNESLDNRQINSTQGSWEKLTESTLRDPENAKNTAESINNSWDLDNLANKEINDVNSAKKLIQQKRPDLNLDWRKDYQIINQAKRIQKEMQAVRRFENRKWNFETKTNNPETVLKSFSYKEDGKDIIITINGSQEIRYKKVFSTWNEKFDNKLNPQLKKYLDSQTYSQSLYNLSFFLEEANSFCVDWRHHFDTKESDFTKVALEMRAKANDLMDKNHIKWLFDNPEKVISEFINTFNGFSVDELNAPGFISVKKLITEALNASKDYTFSSWEDFGDSERISINYKDKAISTINANTTCNMEITNIDKEWIHLKNTVTGKETIFNTNTFEKAKTIKAKMKSDREYMENKEKDIKKKLKIDENTEITGEHIKQIETEMLFDALTNDEKMFNILYDRVAESNARWYSSSINWEYISYLLKKFDKDEKINWRCSINTWKINWKQAIKFDFWNTQIYFSFWEQPKITHEKITQEQINEKIRDEEKSPNYRRALNILETSKNSWKINLSHLNLTSKEVWNLFAEVDIKDIRNLEIDLSWNRITTIPRVLLQQEWIKRLDLSRNIIAEISTDIFRNFDKDKCNLEDLVLYWNNISEIPEELFRNINKLKSFEISGKEITKIPDSIWELTDLQNLNISGTWIETIPDSIINCKNLKSFYADYCKLNYLPNWIWELTKLKSLDLSSNNLSIIPDLSQLSNLRHLDISYNEKLKSIPEISYDNLETLRITWCDNTIPSIEEFKNNVNKLHPNVEIFSERHNGSRINDWENIKERYFSWPNTNERLSWNPNEFFDDNEQYEQLQLVAESLDAWLLKAKQNLGIENNTPVFYIERKRSDWTVSIHIFVKKD